MPDELLKIGTLLLKNMYSADFIRLLVDHACDVSRSDAACLYFGGSGPGDTGALRQVYLRGNCGPAKVLPQDSELVGFLYESREPVVLGGPDGVFFRELLLCPEMQSGMALFLGTDTQRFGILILNSLAEAHYTRRRFDFLSGLALLTGVMFSHRGSAANPKQIRKQA